MFDEPPGSLARYPLARGYEKLVLPEGLAAYCVESVKHVEDALLRLRASMTVRGAGRGGVVIPAQTKPNPTKTSGGEGLQDGWKSVTGCIERGEGRGGERKGPPVGIGSGRGTVLGHAEARGSC